MSVVELLQAYGSAFWKSPNVRVSQEGDSVSIQHPGFYETVRVPFAMMRDFDDVDAAVLMTCKPTGRHGYSSCFRREVLVRPIGDTVTEHVVASGVEGALLADVRHGELHYVLGPGTAVLQLTFSHLYPLDCVDFSREHSILVEPTYVDSIRHDDLSRRLSQMGAAARLREIGERGDIALRRFLIELSAVLDLHLSIWDVPEALEFALMEKKRQACIDDPRQIDRVSAFTTGAEAYLRAIQVNEPYLRIYGLLSAIEAHFTFRAYEGTVARLREQLTRPDFDVESDRHLLRVIGEAGRAQSWRDNTVDVLAELLEAHVDQQQLRSAVGALFAEEALERLCDPLELSRLLHDLRQLVSENPLPPRSRVRIDPSSIDAYLALVQWITMAVMRGCATEGGS